VMNLGAHFNAPRQWTVSPKAQWVSRYFDASSRASRKPLGQDWLLDLRISHQLTTRLLARLDLINITNKKTPKPFGMQDPGFNSFLSLSCSY
jgi:outer membrane receptor for ferric coprogen and ferric-rhodotorulic acid